MALINKNIWLAFYLVSILWCLSLAISTHSTYQRVYDELVAEQLSLTTMSRNSLSAAFEQYESLLNIVASQILKNDQLANQQTIKPLMQATTKLGSSIRGFSLLNLDGTIYFTTSNSKQLKNGSLLNMPEGQDSFKETITSKRMVIGRTYFSQALNTLIIPFRLTVRDSTGAPRFVLSIAVNLSKGFAFFINNSQARHLKNTYLYRDNDRYFQLAPTDRITDPNIYQYQIAQSDIDDAIKRLKNVSSVPFAQLKNEETVFSNKNLHPARQSLAASVYMKEYSLWLVTETKLNTVMQTFLSKAWALVAVHILSMIFIFLLFRNIATSEKKKVNELAFQANHDYLTHLFNRYYYDNFLENLNHQRAFSLIYLNIDHFKNINDTFGYDIGDKLLKSIATKIQSVAGEGDLVFRASSDEFILITFNKNQQQTTAICEQLLSSFTSPILINEHEIVTSASIGVSLYPKDSHEIKDINRNVDLAMNRAKKRRNTTVFYTQLLLDDYLKQCNIESELKKALLNDEFYMVYQPQVSQQGAIIGVEALLRWNNSQLGLIPPDQFIPIAESLGLMDNIGAFVITRTLHDMKRLQSSLSIPFNVSLNVSVKQFNNARFFEQLMQIITDINFPTERLILEVTESILIDDVESIQHLLHKIKAQNIRISLDDFGTGYSSLSILNNLPIDELKIDKSFIDNVIDDQDTHAMVSAIILLAKNKKIKTVAEGVEKKEMLDILSELGCDIYQGYYFSKPLEIKALKQFILNSPKK